MAYSISTGGGGSGWGFSWTANESNYFSSGGGSGGGGSSLPAAQTNFPTSQYGQTIPVVYSKARLPASYIWAPALIVKTSTSSGDNPFSFDGGSTSTTTVTVKLTARLRFGRPLTADSRWSLRRLWVDGTLILNNATGFKKSGLNVVFYDGYSSQGRDPTQTAEEGSTNVSAHRGYLDIVIKNYELGAGADQPPVFEAELIQEATGSTDTDSFTGFGSYIINTPAALELESGAFYGVSNADDVIHKFSIGDMAEIYAIPLTTVGAYSALSEVLFHYIPEWDRLLACGIAAFSAQHPILINPVTGATTAEASDSVGGSGQALDSSAFANFGGSGILVTSTFHLGYFAVYRVTPTAIDRMSLSAADFGGRGYVSCITTGDVTASSAAFWVCAADTLYKCSVTPSGFMTIVEHASFADDLVYAVWHDDDVIVWTDSADIIRVDGSTGATVWTETVPYQIGTVGATRGLASPMHHNFDGVFYFQESTRYNFTSLEDGLTTEITKSSTSAFSYSYDGQSDRIITTDNATMPSRTVFDVVGDGTQRDLSDFLIALMVAGGFDASEIEVEGVDDIIDGAVIDVTGGVRAIAGSVCEAYSIAMFERAGKIIFKRAATDGAFAVDATFASADYADQGGQAIRAKRLNPEERPAKYGINYRDEDKVYQVTTQWGEIPSIPFPVATTDIGVKADIPIISDADTIKTLATVKVNKIAVERHELEGHLKPKHMDAEPESVAQTVLANRLVTMRLLETVLHPDFTQTFKATEFLSSTAVSISGASGRPIEPTPAPAPTSRYYHLDIPLLAEGHDLAGAGLLQYHVLSSVGQSNWDGATLFRKDGSGAYLALISQVTDGLIGVALSTLPDWDIPYATEMDRSIDVAIVNGDTSLLASVTYEEMLAGANFFAIGQPGRWEVCQAMTITNNADNTYTLESLRRGWLSSEEYTGLHETGDFVVWLSGDNVQRLEYTLAALDQAFDYKAVGLGGSVETTSAVNRTVTGQAETIPKPSLLTADINGADIDLGWVRRVRFDAPWSDEGEDAYEPPLGETLEQYIVRIKDGPDGTVLRTFTVNDATTKKYLAADITTDFGSMPAALTYDIRQVSGTGVICPAREATITL